ncbi:unnamed protein product [Chilo suppressalis]|uniref:Vinculin n=1 Tax=Chilo suppressalis TaxID=168631 RepID=A0ABN8L9L6_CHISP|nr:unnamed protein product [Chilo suppressalis]
MRRDKNERKKLWRCKVGEVPMRKGMPLDFVRKLNRLNSNSVKIVTLLTEPNQANLSEAGKIVDNMEADMPSLIEGVKEAANKEKDEEAKKRMLNELQELMDNMKALSESINTNKPEEAQDASKRIADLSIQMCCAMDPRMKKRGEFCRRSRKSFIEDEKTNASIRRGSCLAAAQHLSDTIQQLLQHMIDEYEGPPLDASEVEELENSAADKMAKLNAAIALTLMAFADPQNIDYGVAVTSMNNINELLPELAKDAKALSSVNDGKNRQEFLDAIQALCDATKAVCLAADQEDHQNMREAAKDYGRASDKLQFTFRRGGNKNVDKEKEILDLSKDVDDKTKALLQKSKELTPYVSETESGALEEACARCADATEDIKTCAKLTASSIQEPHCRSALKAAAENLSSSAQHLAITWKPMVEDPARKQLGDELKDRTMELAKALDRLKGTFAGLDGVPEEQDEAKTSQKLKFITTMAAAKKDIKSLETELNKPLDEVSQKGTQEELQNRLAQKLAQLNAALAALMNATADRDKPDYETAELAVSTIRELMPDIVKDGKCLSTHKEAASRERMMNELRALCEATKDICDPSNGNLEDINRIASKFAASSGKLNYIFNPRANRNDEKQIMGISSSANEKSSQLLAEVQELAQRVDGDSGIELETARCRAEDAAIALHNAACVTAPCIQDPRCQESLISAIDSSSAANQHLGSVVERVLKDPRYKDMGGKLKEKLLLLERELDKLKKACQDIGAGENTTENKETGQEALKMQFIRSATDALKHVDTAYKELDKPVVGLKRKMSPEGISKNLTDALHRLTAAIADLITATANRENPDYLAADDALKVVNQELPHIVKDAKTFSSSEPEDKKAAMLEDLRALCNATKALCEIAPQQSSQEMNQAAVKFAGVSGKLVYMFDPAANQDREHNVVEHSSAACETASELLSTVYSLATELDGQPATNLDQAGSGLADGANALLTTTQVTAPYLQDRSCQTKLLSSVDRLQAASDKLASIWRPLVKDPKYSNIDSSLKMHQEKLDKELEDLRKACQITDSGLQTKAIDKPMHPLLSDKRLKFINTISAVDNTLKSLQEELDKPLDTSQTPVPASIQNKLAQSLARLNAAIASLLAATADKENPDCVKAERAVNEINQLLPEFVRGIRMVSASKEPQTRDLMLADLRSLCDTTRQICSDAGNGSLSGLKEHATILADKSGKLFYAVSPRVDQPKEYEIIDLTMEACKKGAVLLSSVQALSSQSEGEMAVTLDEAGTVTADAADTLLATAQLTAPSIHDPVSRATLISSADELTSTLDNLESVWKPVVTHPQHANKKALLDGQKKDLEQALDKLKKAILEDRSGLQTKAIDKPMHPLPSDKRLKFINTISAVDNTLKGLQEELDKPLDTSQTPVPANVQNKLAHSLARLNAAIASLLAATADKENPDCVKAERAVNEINQVMPEFVRGIRMVSASKEPQTRDLMLADLRSLCDTTRQICSDAGNGSLTGLKEHATSLADKSGKLFYAVSPRVDQSKEYEIIELTMEACKKATVLLSSVQTLSSQSEEEMALTLDEAGTVTADAADTLLATAQLTAPSIHDPVSRATLISSADATISSLDNLESVWKPVVTHPQHANKKALLDSQKKDLEQALDKLKTAILEDRAALKSPMRKAPPPPPPKRVTLHEPAICQSPGLKDVTRDFLHNIRNEETQAAGQALLASQKKKKQEEEKAQQQKLIDTVDASVLQIHKAGEELTKLYAGDGEVIPALSPEQTAVVQKQMEHKLAAANAAAARLLAAQHMSSLNHGAACEPASTLAELSPRIVQDAKLLRGALNEDERKSFMEDVLALFDSTKVLLGAAKNDHRKINESAVMFGNKSAKLLYVVRTDVDPSQEKEVFSLARRIGDSASQLALSAAERGPSQQDEAVCGAAGACADSAGTLLYTAKLVAPSIHIAECQQSLVKATDDLSRHVKDYSDSWAPVQTDEQTKRQLNGDVDKLQRMLDSFKEELQTGKLVKRVPVERITVHNTPLRNLACLILEDSQKRAKQANTPPEQRAKFAKYATDLGQAIRQLDLMYHRSSNAPHDVEKRQQLENAVQGLQVMVLMERPTARSPHDNIVDLTDYVRAVSDEAEKLHKECKESQPELKMVRVLCENIKEKAARTMNPELYDQVPGEGVHDRNDVAEFAEECDQRVNTINPIIEGLEDGKNKINLQEKAARLTECIHLLSFATKCDLATTQSVSLDATLEELTDLEKKIDEMLAVTGKSRVLYKTGFRPTRGRGRLVGAVCGGEGEKSLAPAYASYLDDIRVVSDCNEAHQKQRSKEHLVKVLNLLKTLVMTNSRHVATWQPLDHPETAQITEQIVQELESYDSALTNKDGNQKSVLSEVNINKLLLPTRSKLQVDQKEYPEKLNQASSKLSCAVGTLVQGAGNPQAISRAASALLQAHTHLAQIVNAAPVHDIAHSQKIGQAMKETSLQTYSVLKSAELVSQQPNNYATRSKLLDACNRLNDAISQLVRTTSPSGKLQKECSELIFRSQLQQNIAQTPNWCCSLNYPDTLSQLQNQRDVIEKLNEETPMPRAEFSRSLAYVSSATDRSCQYAAHAAYLLTVADQHKELATEGFVDVARIQNLSEALQESCHRIIKTEPDQAKEEASIVVKQVREFQQAITEAQDKIKDEKDKREINESNGDLEEAMTELNAVVHEKALSSARLTAVIIKVLDSTRSICYIIERVSIVPDIKESSDETKACRDDVLKNSRNLNTKLLALIREVKSSEDDDPMTWVTFGTRKAVLEMFEALINSIQANGKRARILEPSQSDNEEESNQGKRRFVQIQLDLANKWLSRPTVKPDVKTAGEEAARTIISLGEKIAEDLNGQEKEEMQDLITSSEELLAECLKKHEPEKARLLAERLKALKKAIERGVVARVVEDFLEGEEPLADLDILADAEKDEEKRKFLLERKIAELLAHLGRITKTARVVAGASHNTDTNKRLLDSTQQTELLAPMLVQAAQKRVISPDDQAAIEHYQKLLSQYAEALANIRNLCDEAVDPMDFVQTAGETMQKLREDSTNDNDPQKCAYASTAITKLANRVITVSMSSSDVRKDPELQKALREAKERLKAVVPGPNTRPSRIPDWKVTTAEILRTTGEVESVLGGEMIFKKQQTSDEPIFAAALDLHTAIRSWSAKDNEIVAVAKRMAVLVAKLSHYMNTERKRDVIVTAKSIVSESHEVAELARKLAHECSDIRIKTNLLKICERIPTISGQLKMLATVKGSLGNQGLKEDQEDMNMLVANAQNLMLSVQEAVNAAASASVKIMSQRGGPRIRWVRKSYY